MSKRREWFGSLVGVAIVATCAVNVSAAIVVGPNSGQVSSAVAAPITAVTVYSDRAMVQRAGQAQVARGTSTLRLPHLPRHTMLDSVRLTLRGAKLLRLEVAPRQSERFTIDELETLLKDVEGARDLVQEQQAALRIWGASLNRLDAITPAPPAAEGQRFGKDLPQPQPQEWRRVWDFLDGRRTRGHEGRRATRAKLRGAQERLQVMQEKLNEYQLDRPTEHQVHVLAIIDAPGAGKVSFSLEYFVGQASWRPVYDLQFDPSGRRVEFQSAGMVQQTTGEDWTDAMLHLSTAIPSQNIALPELLTWTLGEKRKFMPRHSPERQPRASPLFPPPQPPAWVNMQAEASNALLRTRLSELRGLHVGNVSALQVAPTKSQPSSGRRSSYKKRVRRSAQPRPSMAMAEEQPSMAQPSMAYESDAMAPSAPARSMARKSRSKKGTRRSPSSGTLPLALYDGTPAPQQFADKTLPAVVAAGIDYIFHAARPATVPANGTRIRVPLSADSYAVRPYYEASPALAKTAFLKATVTVGSQRPVLRGPVNLFVAGRSIGTGSVRTMERGGVMEMPLGADEDIKLERTVIPHTTTEGLVSKDDITRYQTKIQIANFKKKAVSVWIVDQIPVASGKDIEVGLVDMKPTATEGPTASGMLRWKMDIPAGKTRTIEFVYTIKRPADWELYQR